MKIGFLGGGHFGHNLANLLARAGHDVRVGLRDPHRVLPDARYRVVSLHDAARHGEVVFVAVLYSACAEVLPPLAGDLAGKIVVDATNALQDDWSPMLEPGQSAAQNIAHWLPSSRLVKAFNTVFAAVMQEDRLDRNGHRVTTFIAGDEEEANARIASLARDAGFAPMIVGRLTHASYLEAMAHLNIQMAVVRGGGTDAAFIYHQHRG
jgi:predicted dinucleotide-binding enzyme